MVFGMSMGAALDPDRWRLATKSLTFDGGTTNGIGDENGTGDPADLFNVTGQVIARVIAVCTDDLTFDANATIEVGIEGGSEIIATTDLTVAALTAKEIWHDTTPDSEIEDYAVFEAYVITDGNDITLDCGVANVTGGTIEFYCLWIPLSSDALLVAA
jgi:hypothetical protein